MKIVRMDDYMTCIICALKEELKPFLEALKNKKVTKRGVLKINLGTINGIEVMAVCCGVGIKNADAAIKSLLGENITRVIMSGTAGGIDGRLKICDTVVSDEVIYHSMDSAPESPAKTDTDLLEKIKSATAKDPPIQNVYFGRVATGEVFVTGKNHGLVAIKYNPLCVDMETAAVAYACEASNIPFIAVRSITDTREKSGLLNFYRYIAPASRNSFNVVSALLNELTK
jgi:adenosylhomocysteine nucleosidase